MDACPYAWFATVLTGGSIETKVFDDFSKVHSKYQESRVFVDIPIELPTGTSRRYLPG
ncbi:DUF429 domain-containing protein [Haladaptatus sp. DYSN1]|uniref:DUF429 domain-containing protein n=1 Tax=unclassified Haladaptatus TaxID=2622732 RepID=UPI0034E96AA3